ncbi:MAG: hypothetical protein ABWW69_01345, partial [Pyrodictiaceae archaeon]
VSGGVRRRLYGTGAWLEVPQAEAAEAVAKAYRRLREAGEALEALSQLVRNSLTPPRGPAVLEVPEDMWMESVEYSRKELEEAAKRPKPASPEARVVDGILEGLTRASRPIVFVSGEATEWGMEGVYEEIAERSGA